MPALRSPAVRFALSTTARGLRLQMAAPGSHHAGQLVAMGNNTGLRRVYGRMNAQGEYRARVGATQVEQDIHAETLGVIIQFAADPAGYSAAHGRQTGQCCYCGRGLTDARSVAVGYGPICADHFGLPWGDTPAPTNMFDAVMETGRALGLPMDGIAQPAPTAGVVTNTYRRVRAPTQPTRQQSQAEIELARRAVGGSYEQAARERFAQRLAARRPAATATTPTDETQSTFTAAQRRPASSPLEEDDFKWPPQQEQGT